MTDTISRQVFAGQYEYIDVWFQHANQDVIVTYKELKVDDPESVRWIDVRPGGLADGTVAHIYRVVNSEAKPWVYGKLVLRCTVANYRTRLLVFTERT